MLDTIKLLITMDKHRIAKPWHFNTTKKAMRDNPAVQDTYVNKYSKTKKSHLYYPKAVILKQGLRLNLLVEFSAPKLLFNENLSELADSDFDKVVDLLKAKLLEMGVEVNKNDLIKAHVLSFHPSKNIDMDNISPQSVIRILSKLGKYKKLDINHKVYPSKTNSGESLVFHSDSHEMILYDKMADLMKYPKRSIDEFKPRIIMPDKNILRIEVRLIKKQKINNILKRVGYTTNPMLKDIFNSELCKLILLTYWHDFFGGAHIVTSESHPLNILDGLLTNSDMTVKKAIQLTGFYLLANSEDGIGGMRSLISGKRPKSNWSKLQTDINLLNNTLINTNNNFMVEIEKQLKQFHPCNLSKYYHEQRYRNGKTQRSNTNEEC